MRRCAAILVLWLSPCLALAQDGMEDLQRLALENLGRAMCGSDAFCDPATPSELARPPLTRAIMEETVAVATMSAAAEGCGFDYRSLFYRPYMRQLRRAGSLSDRQLALVGIVHGITMGMTEGQPVIACTDEMRSRFEEMSP